MTTLKESMVNYPSDKEELFKVRMGTGCMPNMCNPPGCSTVKEFLDAGHTLAKGDLVTNLSGYVVTLESDCYDWNTPSSGDANRHVLKAKALESKTRTKVEYVLAEFNSDKERAEAFLEGNLYRYSSGEATGSVEEDTYPLEKLADMFIGVGIFRRIETEMSEKDEFVNEAIECIDDYSSDDPKYFKVWFESMYESGKFKLVK